MASARRPRTSSKPAAKVAGSVDRDEDGVERTKQRVRERTFQHHEIALREPRFTSNDHLS